MVLRSKLKRSTGRTNKKVSESISNYEVLLPNDRPKLVTSLDEVIENIKNFSLELESYENDESDRYVDSVMENMSHYRAWYAYKDEEAGAYLFAPSKYIGYQNMSSSKYFETYAYMDGRKTEKILSEWFEMLDESDENFNFLNRRLLAVFSATGKTVNALFRINVLKREEDNELLEKDLVDLLYKVFLGLSDEGKILIKQKILKKV